MVHYFLINCFLCFVILLNNKTKRSINGHIKVEQRTSKQSSEYNRSHIEL